MLSYLEIFILTIFIILFLYFNMPTYGSNDYHCRFVGGDRAGVRRSDPLTGETTLEEKFGDRSYQSRLACLRALVAKMDQYSTSRDENYNYNHNYTGHFNSWVMSTGYMFSSCTYKDYPRTSFRDSLADVRRTLRWATREGPLEIKVDKTETSSTLANNMCCHHIFRMVRHMLKDAEQSCVTPKLNQVRRNGPIPKVQIGTPEKLTEAGDATQSSDKKQNTIITMDQAQSKSIAKKSLDTLKDHSSSEPTQKFGCLTQRWMPLEATKITTSNKTGDILQTYFLPEGVYSSAQCAPNLTPFETYIYGRMDIEMRIVANANKFHCGKLLVSSKYDSYQADGLQAGYQSALSRNHVIIDLSSNNEGLLVIPFRYHRPWVRLVKNDTASLGVRPSKYASVYLHVLSPLLTGPDGSSEVSIRVFYRFKDVDFTGMSYRVKVQMLGVEDFVSVPTCKALKEVLVGAEKAFDQLGKSRNQDKPGTVEGKIFVPRARLNFGSGKGIVDVQPLRVNPHTLTNYQSITCPDDEPKSFLEMARIWGVVSAAEWKKDAATGTSIVTMNLDPMSRSYYGDYSGEITPLEYACSNFMFWSGTIELRFDFVSNSFHTGTVQISAEFGRTTASETECESSSTYTKMFHLGEQKSVSFRVPYIYDTVMRRTTDAVFNPYLKAPTSDTIKNTALTVAPFSKTFVKMRVINQLKPVASAPQSIEILTFMRAGPDFMMHGLKNFGLISYNIIDQMNNFPEAGYAGSPDGVKSQRSSRSQPQASQLSSSVANDWGEYRHDKFPKVQMETGEKENLDTTDQFKPGPSNLTIQTLDCQMSFKDLLRRPCLILLEQDLVPQKAGGFFIPLMPPSRMMSYLLTDAQANPNSIWAETIDATSAKAIMDCFRLWRGGMRYTIVINSGTKPLYASLVPHSGVRIVGNHSVQDRERYPLYGCNFNTEIIHPLVNPTAVIEAPYDTENTWTYTFEESATRNYSWRDKGDTNAGHLVLNPVGNMNVTVFWSAADDFEVANYYGIPYAKQNGWAYRWDDQRPKPKDSNNMPRTQMDFQTEEPTTTVDRLRKILTPKNVLRASVAAVPFVGPGLAIGSVADDVHSEVQQTTRAIERGIDKVSMVAEKLSCDVDSISAALHLAIEKAGTVIAGLTNGAVLCYDFLLDLLMAWMEKSWRIVAMGLLRFVSKILPTNSTLIWSTIQQYVEPLTAYIRSLTNPVPTVQLEINPTSTITGVLIGLVGTIFGVTLDTRRRRSLPVALLERLTSSTGVSYLLGILRFVQGIFDTLKTLVMEALGYVSPEAQALKKLSENNEQINHFIREAQIITSESNSSCLNSARYRKRFWHTVLTAHQLQKIMCSVPTNCVSAQLARLCGEVIKTGNEKFMDVSASPVRFEPMVICVEGPSGIGKSYATEEMVHRLLKSVGFSQPSSEQIFYRTAGEKFWSGYRDQPVVVYDEWLNTNDSQRCTDMITELMKIKSTAVFIPEMAHLEEKKIRGNPYLIIMLCNNAFPSVSDYARCPDAVFRRRDIVLHCSRVGKYVGIPLRDLPEEELRDFPHLQYQIYKEPEKNQSRLPEIKNFNETMAFLENRFKRYWAREQVEVKKRMDRLPEFLTTIGSESIRLEDPFALFYELNYRIQSEPDLSQNAWTPYEQLEMAVANVAQAIESHQRAEEPPIEVPEKMEWSDVIQPIETQGMVSLVVGALTQGRLLNCLASASFKKLQEWEQSINPIKTVLTQCVVCLDQVECAFTCKQARGAEIQHTMCVPCYQASLIHGLSRCPMCRCEEIIPILGYEEIANLALWSRLAFKFNYGMQWLCKKIMRWYSWREHRPTIALVTDYLLCTAICIARAATTGTADTSITTAAMVSHAVNNTTIAIAREITLQGDSWDSVQESPNVLSSMIEENEGLTPKLNEQYFKNVVAKPRKQSKCLHDMLLKHGHTADLQLDEWIITDIETNVRVKMSIFPCELETCPLKDEARYRLLAQAFVNRNKRRLRIFYIQYFNEPSKQTLQQVPKLVWAPWMTDYEEQPLSQAWWMYITDLFNKYKIFLQYILGLGAVLGSVVAIYRVTSAFITPVVDTQFGGSQYAGDSPRHRRAEVRTRTERRYFQGENNNPSVFDSVQKYICKNMVKFMLTINGKVKTMYGVGLFGHYVLVPRHYIIEMKRGIQAQGLLTAEPYARPQEKINLNLRVMDLVESGTTDLAYLKLPASFQIFKDLRKYLCTEDDLDRPLPASGILMACPGKGKEYIREVITEIHGISSSQVVMDQDNNAFEVNDVLVYGYSQAGVCGSLLLRENHQRPILSMHFAGVGEGLNGEGFGVLLTQEALNVLVQIDDEPVQLEDREFGSIEDATIFFNDNDVNLHYLGSVPKDQVPYIPTKSNLTKSLLFGVAGLETVLEPTILDKQDPRYSFTSTPLYEGVKKHGVLTTDFNREELLSAKEMLWTGWIGNLKPLLADPKILTIEEAIVGFPEHEYYKAMDLKTSAGYPYICGPKKKKLEYVEPIRNDQQQIIGIESISPIVLEIMTYKENLRRQGIIPITTFVDTLKDEKRKMEKARKLGGTRVFCSSPMDYSIECRRYFMHFIAAFMADRMNMMHGVGINPTSSEWGRLISKLLVVNSDFVTIDYSNFGPGYNAGVAEMAYELMIDWVCMHVKNVDKRYLRVLVWECIQSTHIVNNTVYQQHGGSPSGAVFTTIVNTIVNQLYVMLAWKRIMTEQALQERVPLIQYFKQNICLFTYGDDLIMTVSPKCVEKFNTLTITQFFKQYNIVATSADKTAEIVATVPLSQATFLKRGFFPHPFRRGEWLSPLDWESVVGATQWVWKSPNLKEATLVNCQAALLQAHGHGKTKYYEFKHLVDRALKKKRLPMTTLTWEEIDNLFYTTGLEYITDQLINQI
ncbi:hypothetical protein [Hubei picorna-like virus 40]|uniref:hypothetical protein n=1 Tax=Hubei picorna-like virus 40 TaxID=1923121 RepID=UPI00090A0ABA|nr:hypothetical protein [Hubei picorna-like virus 40]APG78464.1 hypothetical protein [Hubei picorna-like virus 40]